MNSPKKSGTGDEGNTSFVPQHANLAHVKAGFDAGEQRVEMGGASAGRHHFPRHRFPRRKNKEEIPQDSLAQRLRAKRSKG
jgi:hypothetical protein